MKAKTAIESAVSSTYLEEFFDKLKTSLPQSSYKDLDHSESGYVLSLQTLVDWKVSFPKWGFQWNNLDQHSTNWYPQGISQIRENGEVVALVVAWYSKTKDTVAESAVRLSFIDLKNPTLDDDGNSQLNYVHVLLVTEPDDSNEANAFQPVKSHAGGIAIVGNYLYLAGTAYWQDGKKVKGLKTFDITKIFKVDGGGINVDAAWGFEYIMPEVANFALQTYNNTRVSYVSVDWTVPESPNLLIGNFDGQLRATSENNPPNVSNWKLTQTLDQPWLPNFYEIEDQIGQVIRTDIENVQGAIKHSEYYLLNRTAYNGTAEGNLRSYIKNSMERMLKSILPLGQSPEKAWKSTVDGFKKRFESNALLIHSNPNTNAINSPSTPEKYSMVNKWITWPNGVEDLAYDDNEELLYGLTEHPEDSYFPLQGVYDILPFSKLKILKSAGLSLALSTPSFKQHRFVFASDFDAMMNSQGWDILQLFQQNGKTYRLRMREGLGHYVIDKITPDNLDGDVVESSSFENNWHIARIYPVYTKNNTSGEMEKKNFLYLMNTNSGQVNLHEIDIFGKIGAELTQGDDYYDFLSKYYVAEFYVYNNETFALIINSSTYHRDTTKVIKINSNGTFNSKIYSGNWSSGWNRASIYTIQNESGEEQPIVFIMKYELGNIERHSKTNLPYLYEPNQAGRYTMWKLSNKGLVKKINRSGVNKLKGNGAIAGFNSNVGWNVQTSFKIKIGETDKWENYLLTLDSINQPGISDQSGKLIINEIDAENGLIGADVTPKIEQKDWQGLAKLTSIVMEDKTYLFLLNEKKGNIATYIVSVNDNGELDLNKVG